jgi:hypothetical protein
LGRRRKVERDGREVETFAYSRPRVFAFILVHSDLSGVFPSQLCGLPPYGCREGLSVGTEKLNGDGEWAYDSGDASR